MGEKLVATVEQRRGGARVVRLEGVLDEHNELPELVESGAVKTLINLAGVERINSSGTRDWVNWLASLDAKGIRPVLVACSPAVVAQLNLVKNFAGNAVVKSVQVPYYCAACDQGKTLLVNVADLGPRPHKAPPCTCEGCGKPMTFVDELGTYFAFVSQLKPEPKSDSAPDLARGSNAASPSEPPPPKRTSEPRLTRASSPYLSASQVSGGKVPSQPRIALDRPSQRQLRPPARTSTERPYLIAIVGLMLCTIAVLLYLLGR